MDRGMCPAQVLMFKDQLHGMRVTQFCHGVHQGWPDGCQWSILPKCEPTAHNDKSIFYIFGFFKI